MKRINNDLTIKATEFLAVLGTLFDFEAKAEKVIGLERRRKFSPKFDQMVENIRSNPIPGENWNLPEETILTFKVAKRRSRFQATIIERLIDSMEKK